MDVTEVEEQGFDSRHTHLQDASVAGPEMKTPAFLLRMLLFFVTVLFALGARIKLWYRSAPTQGNLPNLHID